MAAIRYINVGTTANDNTGSTLRGGAQLINNNFSSLITSLSTDGTTITINTSSTPSNTYVGSTFVANTYAVATYSTNATIFSTFAQNTATIALINDRVQVANVQSVSGLANTNAAITSINTNLTSTNTALRTLISDRLQVANTFSVTFSGASYSTVPNYGAAVTYDVSANGSSGYLITNMGFDKIGNNPAITVRNESTIAFDLNGLGGAHPFAIQSTVGNYSNTLIHVATDGTISSGASAQGKVSGVLFWQIPHDISGTGNQYKYQCTSHAGMKGNVVIKDTGAI